MLREPCLPWTGPWDLLPGNSQHGQCSQWGRGWHQRSSRSCRTQASCGNASFFGEPGRCQVMRFQVKAGGLRASRADACARLCLERPGRREDPAAKTPQISQALQAPYPSWRLLSSSALPYSARGISLVRLPGWVP